ncbi:MAG: TldD/PmbA family protein [Candidatus Aenigmarchaeota archaeon]|nr:TldD/PmbA family protein [Candidatus Aenigmarchaeota archaeon]
MKEVLLRALDHGKKFGARYVDIRYEDGISTGVSSTDGKIHESGVSVEKGIGVRALVSGGWGFCAMPISGENINILKAVENAVKLAKANDKTKIRLAEVKIIEDTVNYQFKKDPMEIPLEEKAELCREVTKRISETDKSVKKSSMGIVTAKAQKIFCSSEGTFIEQKKVFTYFSLGAVARSLNATEYYSWEEGYTKGYEVVDDYDPLSHAEEIAKKAVSLANAKPCPTIKTPVLLDPNFVALITHEVLGHPSEADRVLGKEAAWAGRAWWKDEQNKKIFSDKLTVVSDPTMFGNFGSYKYDDEGVPTRKIVHVQNGVLKEFLHSRETAETFDTEPNGGMRATAYVFAPLIRMPITYIEKGDATFEEMLADMKDGVYVKGHKIPSVDSRRYNFQISAKEAYMIKNGELTEHLRGPTLTGVTPEFFSSIDAVGKDVQIFGVPNCGKGDPMQTLQVGNGGPHIRGVGMVTGPK